MNNYKTKKYKYLIIAGTSKAATTSLFNYFFAHPSICPSTSKETRFFLDADYPLPSQYRYADGIDKYLNYFNCNDQEKFRFESSPDYMYSKNTAKRIRDTLEDVNLIFVLREPISRLISWFKFGKLAQKIPLKMTFDEYIFIQMNSNIIDKEQYQHPAFLALKHGKYSEYLKSFIDLFENKNVYIGFYENFLNDSEMFVKNICKYFNIDTRYFDNNNFEIINKSFSARSTILHNFLYFNLFLWTRKAVNNKIYLRKIFKKIRYKIEPFYYNINMRKDEGIIFSKDTLFLLQNYYKNEISNINLMFGKKPPWNNYTNI